MASATEQNAATGQKRSEHPTPFGFREFHRIGDIYSWLDGLAARHAGVASAVLAGRSYEGRPIRGLCLFAGAGKPRVLVEAGMHGQEWITTSTACWIINHLLAEAPQLPQLPRHADRFEWHVFPNVNPDGYEYSFLKNRSWRKTRSKGLASHGVDGNRNWAYGWTPGTLATRHPSARNYPGRAPFCEQETRALAAYVRSLEPGARLKAYFSLHSSKQMIMFPWGCSREPSADHDELMEIATKAADALRSVHGTKFVVGPISTTIYMAPGNSVDWAYSLGVKYAFAVELRNPVKAERYVRASAIEATAEETFAAIMTILDEVALRTQTQRSQ